MKAWFGWHVREKINCQAQAGAAETRLLVRRYTAAHRLQVDDMVT